MQKALVCCLAAFLATGAHGASELVTLYDFTLGTHGWSPANNVDRFGSTPDGLEFDCVGEDPYVWGPPVTNMPLGERVLITIRMRSDGDGGAQLYYGASFSAAQVVGLDVCTDGAWHEYEVLLPAQEPGTRLRLDPASGRGHIAVAWIKARAMVPAVAVEFRRPRAPRTDRDTLRVESGKVGVAHGGKTWGGFAVLVDGQPMAMSHAQARIGIMLAGEPVYVELEKASFAATMEGEALRTTAKATDACGARWTLSRAFAPIPGNDAIAIITSVVVDNDRDLFHLPMLTLFPGAGSFGAEKAQAVLPGVEYLANEPSSSEADVRGEMANRRAVDDYRLCFPMMSVVADAHYVGLAWERKDHPAPVFDSPDRVFGSGGHLMGLWYPAVGECRLEGELDILKTFPMAANVPMTIAARVFGGLGETVNRPVEHYVRLTGGLPEPPEYEGGFQAAINLLAHGWLDSALHVDGTWRHAVWGDSLEPRTVTDAPGYMLWLAAFTQDAALAERLRAGARRGLERVRAADRWSGHCAHVVRPFVPLIFGDMDRAIEERLSSAWQGLGALDEQGLVHYRPEPGGVDYGSTHWEDHANGLGADRLEAALETAGFSGDETLTVRALDLLDKRLEVYRNTVPRGAQTWEIPLHTPDILASARMLRCCGLAFLLTGDSKYIEAGRYWAWTGVSMVYLDPPTDGPTGLYATTGVLGATAWIMPHWIGQPVQWCGLVYRSALHDFAKLGIDEGMRWNRLARGLTFSGLQQSFPLEDRERQGLLPDYYHLKPQKSDGPAISPGTVQANLGEAYGVTPIYDARRLGESDMIAHVPGGIGRTKVSNDTIALDVDGWYADAYWVRITGIPMPPRGATMSRGDVLTLDYDGDRKALNVQVSGEGRLVINR